MPPVDQGMPQEPPMGDMPPADDEQMPEGPEDDPKKKIQQKAGKISNELSSYQGQDKVEVAKYVKGMIDKAADNIIDGDDSSEGGEPPMDSEPTMGPEPQMESVDMTEDIVREIVNDVISKRGKRDTNRGEKKITNKKVSKKNPFLAER